MGTAATAIVVKTAGRFSLHKAWCLIMILPDSGRKDSIVVIYTVTLILTHEWYTL